MKCKNCAHWKNQQSELAYSKFYGICTCHKWNFSVAGGADVVVLDRKNLSSTHTNTQRFEAQNNQVPIGEPKKSNYAFVTGECFGCIHFLKTK